MSLDLKKHFSLIENFISYFLFKAIDSVIPLIIIPYLFNVVSEENYGIYAFAFSLIFYFQNIIQFGFDLSAVRDIALIRDDKKKLNKVYNDTLTAQFYLFLGSIIILTALLIVVPDLREHYIIYCFFTILLFGELLFPMWFFLGMEKMRFITIVNIISKSMFALFCFTLIKTESQYIYISLYHSMGFLIAGLIAQIFIYKKFDIAFKISKPADVKIKIEEAWSSFLTMASPTIYYNTSIFLVGNHWPKRFAGVMEIGTKVSGAFGVVNTIMTNVLYPFLNRNKNAMHITRYIFVIMGIMLSLSMYFLSAFLIELWLGEGDTTLEIERAVRYLSPSPFLASVISAFGVNGLMIYKKDKLYSKIIVFGSVCGLVAGLLLIPTYNYVGGAITIITALTVKALLSFVFCTKVIKENKNIPHEV